MRRRLIQYPAKATRGPGPAGVGVMVGSGVSVPVGVGVYEFSGVSVVVGVGVKVWGAVPVGVA